MQVLGGCDGSGGIVVDATAKPGIATLRCVLQRPWRSTPADAVDDDRIVGAPTGSLTFLPSARACDSHKSDLVNLKELLHEYTGRQQFNKKKKKCYQSGSGLNPDKLAELRQLVGWIGNCPRCTLLAERVQALRVLINDVEDTGSSPAALCSPHTSGPFFASQDSTDMLRSLAGNYPTCSMLPYRLVQALRDVRKHTGLISTSTEGMPALLAGAPLVGALIRTATLTWSRPLPNSFHQLFAQIEISALAPFVSPPGSSVRHCTFQARTDLFHVVV